MIDWTKLAKWHRRCKVANDVSGTVEAVSGTGFLVTDTFMALDDFVADVELGSEWWDLLAPDEDSGEDSGDYPCADSGADEEDF